MKHLPTHHWIEQIYATQDNELDCQQFQAALAQLVDSETSGGAETLPEVIEVPLRTHLKQCSACSHEYEALKLVVGMVAQDKLPLTEDSLAQFEAEPRPEHS